MSAPVWSYRCCVLCLLRVIGQWTAGGFVGPFICPSIGFLAPSPWDRSVGGSALILLLLPDLSVSHDSIPQELRAVSTGAQETQIW